MVLWVLFAYQAASSAARDKIELHISHSFIGYASDRAHALCPMSENHQFIGLNTTYFFRMDKILTTQGPRKLPSSADVYQ